MPTKLGKGGHGDQNYVPAGNGDASGEYGDNATGSNIHFTNFKKPDEDEEKVVDEETEVVETEQDNTKGFTQFGKDQDKTEKTIEQVREESANSLIDKCSNRTDENDNTLKQAIEESNDESVKILGDYLQNNDQLHIRFGNAGANAAGYAEGYGTIVTDHSVHTIRHELGHTFDNWYGKEIKKDGLDFYCQGYSSCAWVDPDTGKTMDEMIHEELGVHMYKTTVSGYFSVRYVKTGKDKREDKIETATRINKVYNKYCDKIFDEITGVENSRMKMKTYKAEYAGIRSNIENELKDTEQYKNYQRLYQEQLEAERKYAEQERAKGSWSIYYSNSPEVEEAREKTRAAWNIWQTFKDEQTIEKFGRERFNEWRDMQSKQYSIYKKIEGVAGIVGDTHDYLGVHGDNAFYTTNGHGEHYFSQRKMGGYTMEVFANMFDAYMSKDEWKKECLREMFPQTIKTFEKIFYRKAK